MYEDDIPSSSKIVLLLNHVLPVRAQTYDVDDKWGRDDVHLDVAG
jgi:hypothetical protein